MTNKRINYNAIYVICALLLLVSVLVSGWFVLPAFAEAEQYTSALEDLQTDSAFDIDSYPDNAKDYSIQVIQIAESTSGELFIYTYQPSQNTTALIATEINMSLSESVENTALYRLTFLNSDGVFCKYVVNGLTVSNDTLRYYNISSIYRDWQADIDDMSGNDNTINALAFAVGRLYFVTTNNDTVTYYCKKTDIVEIINPYADFLQYLNGYKLYYSACRSHYVAFSTDKQIDTLQEATIAYDWQEFTQSVSTGFEWKGGTVHHEIQTINGQEIGSSSADGWFAKKYEWERIQTVKEFIATENLTDETKKNLEGKQWVLRFVETDFHIESQGIFTSNKKTDVSNVTILRLKFVTDGIVYNVGAVSDKVTGDDMPGNINTNEVENFFVWLTSHTGIPQWVWKLLVALIPIVIILPITSVIFPVVGQILSLVLGAILKVFKWLGCGLWWLICLPFRGIAALIHKIKDKKDGG